MNFHWIDWTIFIGLFIALNLMAFLSRKLVKGVSHFLVAGRSVGRYLGLESDSMQGIGAITIMAIWQMNYKSGFAGQWWYMLTPMAGILVALTGFGVCRFRETKAMTLGQFVEMRYSKRTRIFFGILAYLAGILNMGIFPAVGAGFFIHYCGFPPEVAILGFQIPTIVLIMVILVGSAAAICCFGGQITLILTNFIQGVFVNIMLIAIMFTIYKMFTWDQFSEAFLAAPNANALLHPYHSEGAAEFSKWFFLIGAYLMFYWVISWSPQMMVTSSAKDLHEARMMRVFVEIKKFAILGLGIYLLPLAAYVLMHHPDFADKAAQVNQALSGLANEQVRSQMLTPATLTHILPIGLFGAFAGVILFAFISTHDSYLLAWGGILIQDVIIPLRGGKPLSPKRHMLLLRLSVVFVAVFIILFSTFFNQVDNIYMFFDISAALYIGSAGIVLLGGLYWKRGTIKAAWVTMISGATLSLTGFVCRQIKPDFLDGRLMSFWISLICVALYVIISLFDKKPDIDFDKLFNRTKKDKQTEPKTSKFRKLFQWGSEVPKGDRILIPLIYAAIAIFLAVFIGVGIYNTTHEVQAEKWANFWEKYLYTMFSLATVFMVWIIIGGTKDLIKMFKGLMAQEVDEHDDGSV